MMHLALFAPLAATLTTPDLDVVLYGAYGCIGHLAAHHLANQSGLKWAIAGRNATKLQELAAELSHAGGASSQPEIIVSPLGGTLPWVKRTRAVATAAGPFSVHEGESLVEACAANGVHYADTSDEFYWQVCAHRRPKNLLAPSPCHVSRLVLHRVWSATDDGQARCSRQAIWRTHCSRSRLLRRRSGARRISSPRPAVLYTFHLIFFQRQLISRCLA